MASARFSAKVFTALDKLEAEASQNGADAQDSPHAAHGLR